MSATQSTPPLSPTFDRAEVAVSEATPAPSPGFVSIFDQETVVDSPISQRSAAPSRAPSVPSSPGYSSADDSRLLYWYAIKRSINGRKLITNTWADCEAHVKVMSLDGKRIFIPDGVLFKKFSTIEQAVAWIK